jgi:hypothetical protein
MWLSKVHRERNTSRSFGIFAKRWYELGRTGATIDFLEFANTLEVHCNKKRIT